MDQKDESISSLLNHLFLAPRSTTKKSIEKLITFIRQKDNKPGLGKNESILISRDYSTNIFDVISEMFHNSFSKMIDSDNNNIDHSLLEEIENQNNITKIYDSIDDYYRSNEKNLTTQQFYSTVSPNILTSLLKINFDKLKIAHLLSENIIHFGLNSDPEKGVAEINLIGGNNSLFLHYKYRNSHYECLDETVIRNITVEAVEDDGTTRIHTQAVKVGVGQSNKKDPNSEADYEFRYLIEVKLTGLKLHDFEIATSDKFQERYSDLFNYYDQIACQQLIPKS